MKGPDLLREEMRLTRARDGKIEPLVIGAGLVAVGEKGGALHIQGFVEDGQGLVAIPLHFQVAHPQLAMALVALGIAQDHGHAGTGIPPTLVAAVCLAGDGQAALLRRLGQGNAA
jgi:hypothetical protein